MRSVVETYLVTSLEPIDPVTVLVVNVDETSNVEQQRGGFDGTGGVHRKDEFFSLGGGR